MNYEARESALRLLLSRGDTLYNFDRKPLSFSRWEKSPRIFHLCSINYIANQTTNNVSFFLKRRILIIRESDEYFSIFLTQLILLIREDVQISFNLRGEIQSENLFVSFYELYRRALKNKSNYPFIYTRQAFEYLHRIHRYWIYFIRIDRLPLKIPIHKKLIFEKKKKKKKVKRKLPLSSVYLSYPSQCIYVPQNKLISLLYKSGMAPLSIVRSNGATGRLQYLPSGTSQDKGWKRRKRLREGRSWTNIYIYIYIQCVCVCIRSNARRVLPHWSSCFIPLSSTFHPAIFSRVIIIIITKRGRNIDLRLGMFNFSKTKRGEEVVEFVSCVMVVRWPEYILVCEQVI